MFRDLTHRLASLAAVVVVALACPLAIATQYTVSPRIHQYYLYDDNLRLAPRQVIKAHQYRLSPGLNVAIIGDAWNFRSDARLDFFRLDESDYDSNDQHITLSVGHRSPRRQLQLEIRADKQSQRIAEIESTGVLGLRAEDTARFYVRPASVWQLSELYSLTVGGSFTNQQYDLLDFQDYKSYGLDVTLSRQLSNRMLLELVTFANQYDSNRNDLGCSAIGFFEFVCIDSSLRESETLGAQIGLRRALREGFEWSVSVGGREVDSTDTRIAQFCNVFFGCNPSQELKSEDSSSGLIASTSLKFTGTKLSYEVGFQRSVSPAGIGFLLETDRFDVSGRYRLTEFLNVSSRLLIQRLDSATPGQEYSRDYESIEVSVPWRMTSQWRLIPGLRWRSQEVGVGASNADSTTVFFNVYYRPQRLQFSR